MQSQWYDLKPKAVNLRKQGASIRYIENKLRIPRSTLSGWFKTVELGEKQKLLLASNWKQGLAKARRKAALWHKQQKQIRLQQAKSQALTSLGLLGSFNESMLELAFAMLYLGEGFKKPASQTGMGNTDPLILQFFIVILRKVYGVDRTKIRCELHLRADQDPEKIRHYWSKQLRVPLKNFTSVSIDKRTQGSPTYASYKGVCVVKCGYSAIQRKTIYLGKLFTKQVVSEYGGG